MASSTHGECICLHIGQAGCQIGQDTWTLFCKEHCVGEDGKRDLESLKHSYTDVDDTNYNTFFAETHAGQHVPRAVFIDTCPSTKNEILAESPELFHPENVLGYNQDCKSNFFEGRFMANHMKVKEDVIDRVRLQVDLCSNLQGFFVFHAFGGGTGSGVGCEILHDLHDAFDKKVIFQPTIYPSRRFSSSMVEPYNCIFATYYMKDVVDVTMMMDNEAVYRMVETKQQVKNPDFHHVNHLIAQTISACTTSLRFEAQLSAKMVEIVTNLVPARNFRYPVLSLAPVRSKFQERHETFSPQEIAVELFETSSVLCDVTHLKTNRYLSAVILLRGVESNRPEKSESDASGYPSTARTEPLEANKCITAVQTMKDGTHRSPVKFAPWVSAGFKVGLVGVPPVRDPHDEVMAEISRLGAMLANSTVVRQVFVRQYTKFLQLFYHRAYVWQFIDANGEIDAFYEAREGVKDIICNYEELLRECAKTENERMEGGGGIFVEGGTNLVPAGQ
ncbi:unnamed protein product [Symbiodinium necroappetens]|uniref:Tubulin alpha chain n=1 Tax=Symbiodinium necroappetens TaxID=1628268 RepID=A0A813A4J1_9DINO|nr:unnamed protein product [Symbiodinium sp. KB8]CAE7726224.1 unnamed protein product [Symbiodinium microadriaticum]CAE7851380.1 unnamed protein product [Symbiodinium necroappetens]|mmetsp:Transcript_41945/g.99929  ORF Transcript_41945/g.99929 Transcript_41945/m.99929 type:complete len:504 (+) Transcript_41945:38-1549(+)